MTVSSQMLDQLDIGRRLDGDQTAPARRPTSHRAVAIRFMSLFAFNRSLRTDLSVDSLRILNNAPQREREKDAEGN